MHNCKSTRNSLIELAMNELPSARATQLLIELKDCPPCQEEYFSLRSVLRVSDQTLRSTLPGESFWSGYHARLSTRLENYSSSDRLSQSSPASGFWTGLWKILTASVRIPVPAAAALVLLVGVLTFFAAHERRQVFVTVPPQAPIMKTITVEVPVFREKVVTRVVYVEKARPRSGDRQADSGERQNVANKVPSPGANAEGTTAMSLIGFKPTEQVKLKVVKGSYRDEK